MPLPVALRAALVRRGWPSLLAQHSTIIAQPAPRWRASSRSSAAHALRRRASGSSHRSLWPPPHRHPPPRWCPAQRRGDAHCTRSRTEQHAPSAWCGCSSRAARTTSPPPQPSSASSTPPRAALALPKSPCRGPPGLARRWLTCLLMACRVRLTSRCLCGSTSKRKAPHRHLCTPRARRWRCDGRRSAAAPSARPLARAMRPRGAILVAPARRGLPTPSPDGMTTKRHDSVWRRNSQTSAGRARRPRASARCQRLLKLRSRVCWSGPCRMMTARTASPVQSTSWQRLIRE